MNLPLLKDNLDGFLNVCGAIPRSLEELLKLIIEAFGLSPSRWRLAGRKIFNDSLSAGRKLVGLHDCLYVGGFASLLSQNSYCATLRITLVL